MPSVLTELPVSTIPFAPPRKRWNRAEFDALQVMGPSGPQRLELIDGELIDKMGKKRPHINCAADLLEWLQGVFGKRRVTSEAPIDVSPEDNPTSEPEPDIAVLAKPVSQYRVGNPEAADIRLLIEISDTTLAFDRTTKAGLYARAGILDYWVLDVANHQLYVHRLPDAGRYTQVEVYTESEAVAPLAAPNSPFPVAEAFGASVK